jgi:hypothetical protein
MADRFERWGVDTVRGDLLNEMLTNWVTAQHSVFPLRKQEDLSSVAGHSMMLVVCRCVVCSHVTALVTPRGPELNHGRYTAARVELLTYNLWTMNTATIRHGDLRELQLVEFTTDGWKPARIERRTEHNSLSNCSTRPLAQLIVTDGAETENKHRTARGVNKHRTAWGVNKHRTACGVNKPVSCGHTQL